MNIVINKAEIINDTIERYFNGIEQNIDEIGGYIEGIVRIRTESILQYCINEIVSKEIKYTGIKIIADGIEQDEQLCSNQSIYAQNLNISEMYGINPIDTAELNARHIYHNILEKILIRYFPYCKIIDITITPYSEHP
jgi:hypothetical protein